MKKTIIAVALGATLALSSCGWGAADTEGTVVSKHLDKGSCKRKDGKTKCDRDEYELEIKRSDGVIVEVDVSRSQFDRANIGQYGKWR